MQAWLIHIERITETRHDYQPEIYARLVATQTDNGEVRSLPRPTSKPYWLITDEDFNRLMGTE